jgi:hypothetical protein
MPLGRGRADRTTGRCRRPERARVRRAGREVLQVMATHPSFVAKMMTLLARQMFELPNLLSEMESPAGELARAARDPILALSIVGLAGITLPDLHDGREAVVQPGLLDLPAARSASTTFPRSAARAAPN